MYYTYILESEIKSSVDYIGHTANIKERLAKHNTGENPHTTKFRSWKLKLYIAFGRLEQAKNFERYLKSGSGHAFANKHF